MGIERLKGSLLSEAKEDAGKIIQAAEAHVARMVEEERSRKEASKKEADKDIERLLEEQRNERIAWARLESKRVLAEAREDAIKGVIGDVFDSLAKARKTPEYKKFLARSIPQAAAELGAGPTVRVCKGDRALVPEIKGAKVVEDLEGLGGAIVESADGKIRIDLTIETMFETSRDEIRKRIHERLFGGG